MKEKLLMHSSNNLLNYNNSSSSNVNLAISCINNEENNDFIKSKIMEDAKKAMDEKYKFNYKKLEINKMKITKKYNP